MSEEESKKLFRKGKYEEIENDEIINYSKDSQKKWITEGFKYTQVWNEKEDA